MIKVLHHFAQPYANHFNRHLITGSSGIWIRNLRLKSNLEQTRITKLVKLLMQKKLVKELKSVAVSIACVLQHMEFMPSLEFSHCLFCNVFQNKRKVYMKYDVQPHKDVVGGALSSGADLDDEFVSTLRQACLQLIHKHDTASVSDIEEFVSSVRISKVRLETEDIQQVVNSLLYDCTIEVLPESAMATGRSFAGKRRRVGSIV